MKSLRTISPKSERDPSDGLISLKGFSLVEIMVVVGLLSLIILALMTVFNSTQTAFRSSVTQTDVEEGGRLAMDLITTDLRAMSASGTGSNDAVNFFAEVDPNNEQLLQTLTPSSAVRTNVLQDVFILGRVNQTWTGIGYVVDSGSTNYINPLYRYSISMNGLSTDPLALYTNFIGQISEQGQDWTTNMSLLLSGVVHFRILAYDPNGQPLLPGSTNRAQNIAYTPLVFGSDGFFMYSNTLPAVVELQLGVLEDRTLSHAEGLVDVAPAYARSNYLSHQAAKVHLFRQQVHIPNFDPAAYQ